MQQVSQHAAGNLPRFHSTNTLAIAISLLLLLHILTLMLGMTPIRNEGRWDLFWDCDTYVWLKRALDLYQSGNWYTTVENYLSFPEAMQMHWTRPVDVVLLFGGWLGSFFIDTKTALEIWARLAAPLIHVFTVLLLSFGTRFLFSNRQFIILTLVFIAQRGIYNHFAAGQIDNHPLLAFGLITVIAFSLRYFYQAKAKYLVIIGVTLALCCWVSIEGLLFLLPQILLFGVLWLIRGEHWLNVLQRLLIVFAISLTLFLMIDRLPSQWLVMESDRLSFIHVGISWLLVLFTNVIRSFDHTSSFASRRRLAIIGSAATIATIYGLFPSFFTGAHPWINDAVFTMLEQQTDEQPYLPLTPYKAYHFFIDIGPLLLTLCYLLIHSVRHRNTLTEETWYYWCLFLVFTPYVLYLYRGLGFFQIVLTLPLTSAILAMIRFSYAKVSNYLLSHQHGLAKKAFAYGVMCMVLVQLMTWQWQVAYALNDRYHLAEFNNWQQHNKPWCQYSDVVPYITTQNKMNTNRSILTDIWAGPEIMYKTGYSVFNTPYHRNGEGINDAFILSYARPFDSSAPAIAQKRNVEYILMCREFLKRSPHSFIRLFPDSLLARLYRGEYPDWLEPVALPENLKSEFVLYRSKLTR